MRRTGLILLLIFFMGILPVNARIGSPIPEAKNTEIQFYDTYNKYISRDKNTLITEEYYEIQYRVGAAWVTINNPTGLNKTDSKTTQTHQDYSVIYNQLIDGSKAEVVIDPRISAEYRIIWHVKGLQGTPTWQKNSLKIRSLNTIVELSWDDVAATKGEISEPSYTDGYLQVIFNIGELKIGETYTLDPAIVVSYTSGNTNYTQMQNRHPSLNATGSAVAQTFTVTGNDFNIGNVTLYLGANGNPTAEISLYLYDITGTYGVDSTPTGAYLAVSEPYNVTPLGVVNQFVNFTFIGANQYKCLSGHQYAIALQAPATTDTGIYNKGNYVGMYIDNTAPTYSGNWANYTSVGWIANATIDMYFIIYETTFWDPVAVLINEAFNFWGIADAMTDLSTLVNSVIAYWTTSITNVGLLIIQQFRIIINVINWYVRWVTRFIDFFINMGQIIVGLLNGTGAVTTGLGNIWTYINLNNWYEAVPVFAFIAWIYSVENRGRTRGEIPVVLDDLNSVINIMSYFTSMFFMVINIVVDYTFRLFDAIT